MSEKKVVDKSPQPFSQADLTADLCRLGVQPGMALLVHSSLSKIGYVPGAQVAVIRALQEVLTPAGTLMMPTHSSDLSDPAAWQNPPIPAAWHQIVRDVTPAFDPDITPTRMMGVIAESFRTWPGVRRSNHPQSSFAAWGKAAEWVTADHSLESSLSEESPLARLYELDGFVLLLGVGHGNNTSFHLAEVRSGMVDKMRTGAPVLVNGRRQWQWYSDFDYDDDDFEPLGEAFEAAHSILRDRVGLAECCLFSQCTAVDFAQQWFCDNRRKGNV